MSYIEIEYNLIGRVLINAFILFKNCFLISVVVKVLLGREVKNLTTLHLHSKKFCSCCCCFAFTIFYWKIKKIIEEETTKTRREERREKHNLNCYSLTMSSILIHAYFVKCRRNTPKGIRKMVIALTNSIQFCISWTNKV